MIRCGGLSENSPTGSQVGICSSPVGGSVLGGLGGVSLEEVPLGACSEVCKDRQFLPALCLLPVVRRELPERKVIHCYSLDPECHQRPWC